MRSLNLGLSLYFSFLYRFADNFISLNLCFAQLSFIGFLQLSCIITGFSGRIQVILNAVCTIIKNLDNRLVAVMTENSAKNNKVEDLNQQCTIKFLQEWTAIPLSRRLQI